MSHRHFRPALLAAMTAIMLAVSSAPAQIGELAGFTESMRKEYVRRDLVLFTESLELDKPQQDILRNLHQDYETAFEDGLANMQQRLQAMKDELQASDQQRILSMIFAPFEEWGDERRQLGEEFLDNVQLILNDQQLGAWVAFKRRLVREKTLSKGVLAGESVNLLIIVKSLDLPNVLLTPLTQVLEEYEITLDQALRNRNETLRTTSDQMVEAMRIQDPAMSLDLIDKQLRVRIRVRDVNDQYIELIPEVLPMDYGIEFRERAMERAYPRAYRSTSGQRMYDAALEMEEIEEAMRQNLFDLREVFVAELGVLAFQIVDDTRVYEPKKHRNRVEMFVSRMSGQTPKKISDPALGSMRQRDELNNQFIEVLQSLLTDEQFESLPGAAQWLKRRNARAARAKPIPSRRSEKVREPGTPKGAVEDSDKSFRRGLRGQKVKDRDDR